jgi:hypothetical protein
MYQAARWNEDAKYYSPMAMVKGESFFIDDLVYIQFISGGWDTVTMGRIDKFFKKVHSECI